MKGTELILDTYSELRKSSELNAASKQSVDLRKHRVLEERDFIVLLNPRRWQSCKRWQRAAHSQFKEPISKYIDMHPNDGLKIGDAMETAGNLIPSPSRPLFPQDMSYLVRADAERSGDEDVRSPIPRQATVVLSDSPEQRRLSKSKPSSNPQRSSDGKGGRTQAGSYQVWAPLIPKKMAMYFNMRFVEVAMAMGWNLQTLLDPVVYRTLATLRPNMLIFKPDYDELDRLQRKVLAETYARLSLYLTECSKVFVIIGARPIAPLSTEGDRFRFVCCLANLEGRLFPWRGKTVRVSDNDNPTSDIPALVGKFFVDDCLRGIQACNVRILVLWACSGEDHSSSAPIHDEDSATFEAVIVKWKLSQRSDVSTEPPVKDQGDGTWAFFRWAPWFDFPEPTPATTSSRNPAGSSSASSSPAPEVREMVEVDEVSETGASSSVSKNNAGCNVDPQHMHAQLTHKFLALFPDGVTCSNMYEGEWYGGKIIPYPRKKNCKAYEILIESFYMMT
ncbi:hypothetical protein FOL46_008647 [Perkinsus olseni]|uniref:Uncharacterized protein n=1 Tax=Perkinsus olseni TaxID=32597 RepID=A0A7J6L656_PEROL|nr:hypothetical protein FOL46_008647 [Perkinsus olseni]